MVDPGGFGQFRCLGSAVGEPVWVGSVRVELDKKLLIERPLVAIAGAPEGGIWRRMVDGFWLWFEDDEAAE